MCSNPICSDQVVKRAPADKDAKAKMVECEKIVRRVEFEKAIEVGFVYVNVFKIGSEINGM